jgi:S-DNA-T family DNA segregation ATPase FtsK/SpoIIIE
VLLVAAVVIAIGTWIDAAGLVGTAVGDATRALVGLAAVVVPVLVAAAGIVLLRGRRDEGGATSRIACGIAVVLTAACGLAPPRRRSATRLAGGDPRRSGLAGLGVAAPLRAVLAGPGALVALLVLLVAGVLLLTRTSPRAAGGHVLAWCAPSSVPCAGASTGSGRCGPTAR